MDDLCFLPPRYWANVSKHKPRVVQLLGIQYVFVLRFNVFKLFIIDMYESKSLPSSSTVNGQGSALSALSIKLNKNRH